MGKKRQLAWGGLADWYLTYVWRGWLGPDPACQSKEYRFYWKCRLLKDFKQGSNLRLVFKREKKSAKLFYRDWIEEW